jgi:hypothetical protein
LLARLITDSQASLHQFLRERNLMDYSLLVGIHFLNYPDIECRPGTNPHLRVVSSSSSA